MLARREGKISERIPEYPEYDFSTSTRLTWKFRSTLTTPEFERIQYSSISIVFNGLYFNFYTFVNNSGYDIPLIPNSVIVADRFYCDLQLLFNWDSNQVNFVVRHRTTLQYRTIKELELPEERHPHVLKDEIIELTVYRSSKKYPKKLRRVAIWDEKNEQVIEVITNQFTWSANTISELYKSRWQIEIFFKEIKQLLHIKSFIGTTENAVMIQIWTALITILVLKALKALAQYNWHLSNLVAFIRLNLFVKVDLQHWLDSPFSTDRSPPENCIQGVLF